MAKPTGSGSPGETIDRVFYVEEILMKRVKFNSEKNEFYGDCGNGYEEISEKDCYSFVNQNNSKCVGSDENEFVIYEKCR